MDIQGEWEFYNCTMDDARTMVFVRTDLHEHAPDASRPWMLLVVLDVRSQRPDGLTDEPETTFLQEVEEQLDKEFTQAWDSVYVGRYTKQGQRTMAYHFKSEPDKDMLSPIIERCAPEYSFSVDAFLDEPWENYLHILYPNDIAWLEISNRPVLDRLEEMGDALVTERHTLHWLYFDKREERDGFIQALKSKLAKFDVVEPLEPDNDFPKFGVRLEHQCAMLTFDLISAQLPIVRLAEEFNGEYDGFECQQVGGA